MHRQLGVYIPPEQNQKPPVTGAPNTVLEAVEIKFVAMVYTDKKGKATNPKVGVKVGDRFFEDLNGEDWAAKLAPLKDWVLKGVEAKLAARNLKPEIPDKDQVEVITATEEPSAA